MSLGENIIQENVIQTKKRSGKCVWEYERERNDLSIFDDKFSMDSDEKKGTFDE